jgi:hypothetical protein
VVSKASNEVPDTLEPSPQPGIASSTEGQQMTAPAHNEFLFDQLPAPPADTVIFENLGFAAMQRWTESPFGVRDQMLGQADDMVGVAPIDETHDHIAGMLRRQGKT